MRANAASTPASAALTECLARVVKEALAGELVASALFVAERLHAVLPTDEAPVYLLALCLLRSGNAQGAIHVLSGLIYADGALNKVSGKAAATPGPGFWRTASASNMKAAKEASLRCARIYAKACVAVGRNREAEAVLSKAVDLFAKEKERQVDLGAPEIGIGGATIQIQLAVACLREQRHDQAAVHYTRALKECWFCWEAFEGLCYIGKAPDPSAVFVPPAATSNLNASTSTHQPLNTIKTTNTTNNTETPNTNTNSQPSAFPTFNINHSLDSSSSFETSVLTSHPPRSRPVHSSVVGLGSALSSSGLFTPPTAAATSASIFANTAKNMPAAPLPARKNSAQGHNVGKEAVRRSTRLTGGPAPVPSSNPALFLNSLHNTNHDRDRAAQNKGKEPRSRVPSNPRERKRAKASPPPNAGTNTGGTAMPVFKAHSPISSGQSNIARNPEDWLRSVLVKFGRAEAHLSRFEGPQAFEALMSLEVEQRRSWRASAGVGRARMETLDYVAAEKAFAAAREAAPYSISHADLHSTLLWHLNRSTDLSYLAQQLMGLAPLSVEAWICTGNVFSLLDDHSNALKCFKRAIQIVEGDGLAVGSGVADSASPGAMRAGSVSVTEYPYVLAGHECVALEEWESALAFFREAIKRRKRCYTPWFGIGNVYLKQGKLRLAEYHMQRAAEINPSNAMLVSGVGFIHQKLGKKKEALDAFERACILAPTSAAVRFRKAKMLVILRRYPAALKDLLSLAALAPDEFNVQFLLGKVYGALGQRQQMTKHFTYAQDLNPRQAQRIRDAIEEIEDKDQKSPTIDQDEEMA